MADGLCLGDVLVEETRETIAKNGAKGVGCEKDKCLGIGACSDVEKSVIQSDSALKFGQIHVEGSNTGRNNISAHEGFLGMDSCEDEDFRKKRCVDRYDSSESSDSGVAVLSCTDCSGSSTASSDITDPGSPFSTTSSHSEDSASQPAKMPPTQTAHHTPWPWATEDSPPLKRTSQPVAPDKPGLTSAKRLKLHSAEEVKQSQPKCLNNNIVNTTQVPKSNTQSLSKGDEKKATLKKVEPVPKMQQGKITEYFKSQMKANVIKKDVTLVKSDLKPKFIVDGVKSVLNNMKSVKTRKMESRTVSSHPTLKKVTSETKTRKLSPISTPRKILPAPTKTTDKIPSVAPLNNIAPFSQTVAFTFAPNLAYIHTKAPKPPDNLFLNAIPIVNRPCFNVIQPNVIQPLQKLTTINNFNCVKLNATVVPIVKLNPMPSKQNGSIINTTVALSVETASPTVLKAKPKNTTDSLQIKQHQNVGQANVPVAMSASTIDLMKAVDEEKQNVTPNDSDSGVSSSKDFLEVSVGQKVEIEPQKSPILCQPKTIRFPAAKKEVEKHKDCRQRLGESVLCQWSECQAKFETSGALLEHLQIKHVISQATQETYVCLWTGCKVHGRKSCSRTWLERHVLAHAGTKPFRCIVDGCGMRFNSQVSLERHVNGHFNTDGQQNGASKKSIESNGSVKLFKRNGKKIRFRRQPWSARMFDFFDGGIMEGLQYQLLTMTEKRTLGQFDNCSGDTVSVRSEILARRVEADGKRMLLVRWHPRDILPDEWMPENEVKQMKEVSIPKLEPSAKDTLSSLLFAPSDTSYFGYPFQTNHPSRTHQKHRRKPQKAST